MGKLKNTNYDMEACLQNYASEKEKVFYLWFDTSKSPV